MKPSRIEMLRSLGELWELIPDFRLGQLVVAVAEIAWGPDAAAPYAVEDEEFLKSCQEWVARKVNERNSSSPMKE